MKLSLAPIQGMTIAPFRNAYADIFEGIDLFYAPFITTTESHKTGPGLFKDILPESNFSTERVIPQLLGNDGDEFSHFASIITDMGYEEINWNIGCPYPMVTKKKKGSGLLLYPELIRDFLETVCNDMSYELTVKMRLGFQDAMEGEEVIRILNDYPLKEVIIHGRVGIQKYAGEVDLDAFGYLLSLCRHEVAYNGDIFSPEDFTTVKERFPTVNHFMLGRGALWNPFLPAMIKGIPVSEDDRITKVKALHDAVFSYYESVLSGDRHLCDRMKEFWTYMSVHLDPSGKSMKKIRKSRTKTAYLDAIAPLLDASAIWYDR